MNNLWNTIKKLDFYLLGAVFLLLVIGSLNLWGMRGIESVFLKKYIVFALIGFAVIVFFARVDYRIFRDYTLPSIIFYIAVIFLLVLTLSVSYAGVSARSWLFISNLGIQASEFSKLALILLLSRYFFIHRQLFTPKHFFAVTLYAGVPTFLTFIQPDFGSAAILVLIWFSFLFWTRSRKNILMLIIITLLLVGFLGWNFFLHSYQKDRITAFLHPTQDPQGIGYQVKQAKTSIGAGGLLGAGIGKARQVNNGLLPEPHTDFAFASLAEQMGFVGVTALLFLIFVILVRFFVVWQASQDLFVKIYTTLLAILIFSHIIINIGTNLGFFPVTGIPLSFLSYGGSHLFTLMIGLGILMSMRINQRSG